MRQRRALGLLTTTHAINDMYQGAIPAMLPFLQAERGYSYALITGITLAATGLSSLVQPLVGLLADRRPMGWLLTAGMLTAGLGVGLSGVGDAYVWTWCAIAVSGLGLAAYHPAGAMAARGIGGGDPQTMSVFAVGGNIGVAVAPLFVALVLNTTGLAGTWILALPAVVMAACYLLARRRAGAGTAGAAPARQEETPHEKPRNDWRAFGMLSVMSVFWSVPFVVMSSFAALYVISRFQVSAAAGSATLTTFTVGGVVGTLLGGWGARRWGRLPAIRCGYLVALAAVLGVLFAPGVGGVLLCTFVYGTALFVPFAAQVTLAQDYLPQRVGTASGLTLGVTLSAGGLLSPLFGLLADNWGVRTVLAALAGVLLVPALLAWRLPETRPTPAPEPTERSGPSATTRTKQ